MVAHYYRVQETDRLAYQFDGAYKWWLPAVRCTGCKRYTSTDRGYPNLDMVSLPSKQLYKSGPPVSKERYEELLAPVARLVKDGWPLHPGMGLGPLNGRVFKKEKRDFLWLFGRTLLLRETAFEALTQAEVRLTTGPAIITNPQGADKRNDYTHVAQLWPVGCMAERTLQYAEHRDCPECGVSVSSWPPRLFLNPDSIPPELDIFMTGPAGRVDPFENIIVSERFKLAVQQDGLTNIAFESVELA